MCFPVSIDIRFGMEPARRSHRELGPPRCRSVLGAHVPACLCTRLSTSSRLSPCFCAPFDAAGWPNGPGRGPPVSVTSSSDQGSCTGRLLDRPRKKTSRLAMKLSRQCSGPIAAVHARFTQTASTCASSTSGIPREMQRSPLDIRRRFQSSTEKCRLHSRFLPRSRL